MKARGQPKASRRRDKVLTALGRARVRRHGEALARTGLAPLFVIGAGRSGNTLVRRVLMATGEIYIPPETYVLGDIIEGWPRGALLTWQERVWLFCAYFEKHHSFSTFGFNNLDEFARLACALPRAERTLPALIDAFYRNLAAAHGLEGARWGDKTPYNTFHLDALEAVFPSARFLWLVRDGRDVALSYVEAGLFDTLGEAAGRWVEANAACTALAQRHPRVRRQSYEALVSAPEEVFADLCAWAELTFAPAMLTAPIAPLGDVETLDHHRNVTRPISAASVGRWRSTVDPDAFDELPAEFWAMMDAVGYERSGGDGE
ncbi:MAG: sulfotransferase [Pseudomonadota bacterium]